jgi:hypothetical protein
MMLCFAWNGGGILTLSRSLRGWVSRHILTPIVSSLWVSMGGEDAVLGRVRAFVSLYGLG